MDFVKVILLGIIEGVTEFLPISSTGHLILAHEFIRLEPASFSNSFDVIIQLGAILSVIVLYFQKLNPFRKQTKKLSQSSSWHLDQRTMQLWFKVAIAFLPAAVLGFLFDDFIDKYLFSPMTVAVALIVWGIAILLIDNGKQRSRLRFESVYDIDYKTAFLIGIFQCFAMIPGTSRSAATIIGAMLLGNSRIAAAEFSFFLAIPTMLGATLLKIVKNGLIFTGSQWILILLGSVVSFAVALIVIKSFLSYIQKHNFRLFGIYRIVLGLIVILYFTVSA